MAPSHHLPHRLACAFLSVAALLPLHAKAQPLVAFSSATSQTPPSPWRVAGIPGGKIALSEFSIAELDGQRVLRMAASSSYGNLVFDLPSPVLAAGTQLRWRWRLDQALAQADLSSRKGDDSAAKVCLLFDLPIEKLGLMERNLLRIARAASGEKLPSATLCYVWDPQQKTGTLLHNAYTSRVRLIVVNGADQPLGQWSTHMRDVTADFQRAFGQESASLPPLTAVLVGADADNTQGQSLAFVGDLTLGP